jgi:hypothetical protein
MLMQFMNTLSYIFLPDILQEMHRKIVTGISQLKS